MQTTRRARLESVILKEVTRLVSRVKDPRIPNVTITSVQLTEDGEQATCFFTVLGSLALDADTASQVNDSAREGLSSAAGYLRRNLAKAITTRHIPTLIFKQDKGLDNSIRVHELLKKIQENKGSDNPQ